METSKFLGRIIGNLKETQKTLKISGLFHFTRLVPIRDVGERNQGTGHAGSNVCSHYYWNGNLNRDD